MDKKTHQQFVDDTMLMGFALVREARAMKSTLEASKKVSNLEVNKDKSHIFFFNTNIAMRRNINQILGFMEGSLSSKYLGAPLLERKASSRS